MNMCCNYKPKPNLPKPLHGHSAGAGPGLPGTQPGEPGEGWTCCSAGGRQSRSLRKAPEGSAGRKHKPKIGSGRNQAESGENGDGDQYLETRNTEDVNSFYSQPVQAGAELKTWFFLEKS